MDDNGRNVSLPPPLASRWFCTSTDASFLIQGPPLSTPSFTSNIILHPGHVYKQGSGSRKSRHFRKIYKNQCSLVPSRRMWQFFFSQRPLASSALLLATPPTPSPPPFPTITTLHFLPDHCRDPGHTSCSASPLASSWASRSSAKAHPCFCLERHVRQCAGVRDLAQVHREHKSLWLLEAQRCCVAVTAPLKTCFLADGLPCLGFKKWSKFCFTNLVRIRQ